jgi:tRNA threonylcarbamoyl adenosine modification protein YeaZ
MNLSLAIDRSIPTASLALFRGEECVSSVRCTAQGGWPSSALDDLFAAAGAALSDIGRAFVGLGPGSFSGIRSALAFAKGLLLPSVSPALSEPPCRPPVAGVPSCAAMAADYFRAHPEAARVRVVGDARRDTLWVAEYAREVADTAVSDIRALPKEDVLKTLRSRPDIPVVTPEFGRLEGVVAGVLPYPFEGSEPLAVSVGRLALSAPASTVVPPNPLYLHPAVRGVRTFSATA